MGFTYCKDFVLHVHIESPDPLTSVTAATLQQALRDRYNNIDVREVPYPDHTTKSPAPEIEERRLLTRLQDEHDRHWHGTTDGVSYLRPLGSIQPCEACGCLIAGGKKLCGRCTPAKGKA